MLHSWDEAKPPAVKHPADIVAQGRASGQVDGVPSSARTRSGCRETLTSVARDPLSQGPMSQSLLIRHQRPCGRRDLTEYFHCHSLGQDLAPHPLALGRIGSWALKFRHAAGSLIIQTKEVDQHLNWQKKY